jgi:hypothetical protein
MPAAGCAAAAHSSAIVSAKGRQRVVGGPVAFEVGVDRHSVLASGKWRLSALPVLTDLVSATLRITQIHHFRSAVS